MDFDAGGSVAVAGLLLVDFDKGALLSMIIGTPVATFGASVSTLQ